MGIFEFLGGAIKPITDLIDSLVTTDDEKAKAKAQLQIIQNSLTEKLLNYENELLKSKTKIIEAEATGQSWLQRNWRPITMLTFLILVCLDSFGLLAFRLSNDAWTLLQIGLGGYVVGRSAEKITPKLKDLKK